MYSRFIFLFFIHLILGHFTLSCGKKFSSNKDTSQLECGVRVKDRYFKVKSKNNTSTLDGNSFKIIVINKRTRKQAYLKPTPKECVTESMVKEASSVLIRKNQNRSVKINPISSAWGREIELADSPTKQPEPDCGMQNIVTGTLKPKNFIDVNQVNWQEFYFVSGKLVAKDKEKKTVIFKETSLLNGEKWDISDIEDGKYILELSIKDEVHGISRSMSCEIDTEKHSLYVIPSDRIKEYRTYFDKPYAVVEDDEEGNPYYISFYEGGLRDVDIEYCLQKIENLGNEGNLIKDCSNLKTHIYKAQENSVALKDGFWNLTYKYSKGDIKVGWQSQRIMVKKICNGEFIDPKVIKERGCTDVQGSIHISGEDIVDLENSLDTVSFIDSNLTFNKTNLSSIKVPNLSYVSMLHIYDNQKIESLDFKQLTRIRCDLSITENKSLANLSGLSNITSVGGYLSISGNDSLTSLSGLSNIISIPGYLEIIDNDSLVNISGLSNITSIGRWISIDGNPIIKEPNSCPTQADYSNIDIKIHNFCTN